jgi:tyrosyl-tRNA synthetase
MTLVQKAEIDAVMEEQKKNPSARAAQKKLAYEVTKLVHGESEAEKAKKSAEALFSGDASAADMPTVSGREAARYSKRCFNKRVAPIGRAGRR